MRIELEIKKGFFLEMEMDIEMDLKMIMQL